MIMSNIYVCVYARARVCECCVCMCVCTHARLIDTIKISKTII